MISWKEVTDTKLNTLLDMVYELNDNSEGVSNDLENIIDKLVQHVEDMIDENDKLLESWI